MKRILLLPVVLLAGCSFLSIGSIGAPGAREAPASPDALSCAAHEMGRLGYLLQDPADGSLVQGEKDMYSRTPRSLGRLTVTLVRDPEREARLRVAAERWEERSPGTGGSSRAIPVGVGDVVERPRPGVPAIAGSDTVRTRSRKPTGWRRVGAGPVSADAQAVIRACTHPRPGSHASAD